MKSTTYLKLLLLSLLGITIWSCSNDEVDDSPTNLPSQVNSYAAYSFSSFSSGGRVDIETNQDGDIFVRVQLDDPASEDNVVKIYNNHFDGQDHGVYLTLNTIASGETESLTEVNKSDDGSFISFEDLVTADRNIRVLSDESQHLSINIFTDLGQNAFVQGAEKNYNILDADSNVVA